MVRQVKKNHGKTGDAYRDPRIPPSPDSEESRSFLLKISLSCAVPLWIERVRRWTPEARVARAHELTDVIASKGDVIMLVQSARW